MNVGERMGLVVDAADPEGPTLRIICSDCGAWTEDVGQRITMEEWWEQVIRHVGVAHRDVELFTVDDEVLACPVYFVPDLRDRKFPRVAVGCDCARWNMSFQAIPDTEVTLNRALACTSEHLARLHPNGIVRIIDGEVKDDAGSPPGRLPRVDAIGPIGG